MELLAENEREEMEKQAREERRQMIEQHDLLEEQEAAKAKAEIVDALVGFRCPSDCHILYTDTRHEGPNKRPRTYNAVTPKQKQRERRCLQGRFHRLLLHYLLATLRHRKRRVPTPLLHPLTTDHTSPSHTPTRRRQSGSTGTPSWTNTTIPGPM